MGQIGNRYLLKKELGAGGMGVVYLAQDQLNRELVALKQVQVPTEQLHFMSRSPSMVLEDLRLSLAREFQMLASLRHPHIISVLDYGFDLNRQPYFTMTYLANAKTILEASVNLPVTKKLELIQQMLLALAYLHRRGVLHRDLKPENVLVTNGQVRVLDFGLALSSTEQARSSSGGTLAYWAPELWRNEPYSGAADLFALGVVAFELLVGQHPFGLVDSFLMKRVLKDEPDLNQPGLDSVVTAVLGKLLAKSPADRYQKPDEVLNDLSLVFGKATLRETRAIRESYLQAATFVGRDKEMAQLDGARRKAEGGHGSIWLIGGESGIGKSRLLNEVRIQALVAGWQVIQGQAVVDGDPSYQLWQGVLPTLLLNTSISDLEASVIKQVVPDIERLMERTIPPAPDLPEKGAQQRLVLTIVEILKRQTQPTLLLLEDLQWAEVSLAPLKSLSPLITEIPVWVVGSFRDDERPNLPQELPAAKILTLARLDKSAIIQLSQSMLGQATGSRQELITLLHQETEGNAFFLVEVVRALGEEAGQLNRIGETALPTGVFTGGMQALIRRRLDKVPAQYQPLLRKAAIVGRELDLNILQVLDKEVDLDHWLSTGLETAVFNVQEKQWYFAHDKLREALLSEISMTEQPTLYQGIAQTIEGIYPDDPTRGAILARLWHTGGNPVKERHYAFTAGQYAAKQYANEEALRFYSRVIALSENVDWQAYFDALLAREHMYDLLGNREAQRTDLARLKEIADKQSSPQKQASVALRQAAFSRLTGDFAMAVVNVQQALKYAQILDDSTLEAQCYLQWGVILEKQADYPAAQEQLSKCLRIFQRLGERRESCTALTHLGTIAYRQGNNEQANEYLEQSLRLSQQLDDRAQEASIWLGLGNVAIGQGQFSQAKLRLEQSLKLCRQTGNLLGEASTLGNLGLIFYGQGAYDQAKECLEQSLLLSRQIEYRMGEIVAIGNLSLVLYALGDYVRSKPYVEQTLVLSRQLGERNGETHSLGNLGRLSWRLGDYEQAQTYYEQAIALCRQLGQQADEAGWTHFMGRLAVSRGAYAEAKCYFQEALSIHQTINQPQQIVVDEAGLAEVTLALGEPAEEHLEIALQALADPTQLDSTGHVFLIYLICYKCLKALADDRAAPLLSQAYQLLEERASKIANPEARQTFLENVTEHRELVAFYLQENEDAAHQ